MNQEIILGEIKDIISEIRQNQDTPINMKSTFEEAGLTSVDIVHVIVNLEKRFSLDISEKDMRNIETIGDLVTLVSLNLEIVDSI